jgi:epsilon-lactone hydrolase
MQPESQTTKTKNKPVSKKYNINPKWLVVSTIVTILFLEFTNSLHPSLRSRFFYILVGINNWLTGNKPLDEQREQLKRLEKIIEDVDGEDPGQEIDATAGFKGEWLDPPTGFNPSQVILYLHGGAYVNKTPAFHRRYVRHLASLTNTRALMVDYRLAPEHPFPAALDDAVAAYKWLLASGYPADKILIAGDSAGGGLTAACLLYCREHNLPFPSAAVLLSPWLDLAGTGNSIHRLENVDRQLNWENLEKSAKAYYGNYPPTHPLVSPLFGDLNDLPPILIVTGGREILLDDSLRFADRLSMGECDVELIVEPNMGHVWSIFEQLIPEAQAANLHVAEFIQHHLNPTDSDTKLQ